MRFLMSLLYVEVTISIDVWRFSRCIAMKLLQARAAEIDGFKYDSLMQLGPFLYIKGCIVIVDKEKRPSARAALRAFVSERRWSSSS